jgi:TolB-like protein
VAVDGDDLMGDGVNVAARLEQLCLPGGVVISGTTYDHLQGRFELPLDFLGEHKVKNITRPVRVYSVRLDGKKPTFTRRLRRGGRVGWGLTVVTVALFALAAFGWRNLATRSPQAPVIAVLPFKNYGPDADARLVGGLTEDIVTELARNGGFLVISSTATKVYEGKPIDLSAVQKELKVRYLLEGSVQRQDDRVKITAQVLDAITGASLWSERYDRPSGEFFDLQGEIADKVANWIYFTIGSAEKSVAKRKRPTDLTAWEVFLLGADKLGIATDTTVHEAQDLFLRAISMDPKLARAHALLSETYEIQAQTAQMPDDLLDKATSSARMAIELDPLDFEGYSALADALCSKGSFDACKLEYERAIQISPNAFEVLVSYAGWASALGAAKEGAEAADRAIRMFPAYPVFAARAFPYAFLMVRRYEDAIKSATRIPPAARRPFDFVVYAASLGLAGRTEDAKVVVAAGVAAFPAVLNVEAQVNRSDWAPHELPLVQEGMQKAGFPTCAPEKDASGAPILPPKKRLPGCSTGGNP